MRPVIGITMGDPAGIGPEICLSALADARVCEACVPVLFGDWGILRKIAGYRGRALPGPLVSEQDWGGMDRPDAPIVVGCTALSVETIEAGRAQKACGAAAYAYVEAAARAAMAGRIDAMATAPLNKVALNLAGVPYAGHTEILAALTGTKRYCMMMACDELVVSLATIHVGHRQVHAHLSVEGIVDTILLTDDAMQRLGKPEPLIAVCALNPHGGEQGIFGCEEDELIEPAIREARRRGVRVEGPLVPDVAFLPERRRTVDAYVVMYHDQGLIPFKMLAFDRGVNVTLGLPIVRTSVDHGTAFDIAWQGKASAGSMVEAVRWAVRLGKADCRTRIAG